jgi:peptidoglycan/LPS O-acetylase OafA/YrhL
VAGVHPSEWTFRPDIQGLRAVAVGLVVLHHAGLSWTPGGYVGVDVFFVISGYLMTVLVAGERERTGSIRLRLFYARRIRRLLPAAALVLMATIVGARVLLPPLAVPDMAKPAALTALFVSNIWFARTGTDYLADGEPSPFRHYWSLAVEGQFYLVWPVLLLLGYRWFRGRRRSLTVSVGVLSGVSLAMCVVVTSTSQPWAFFGLPTRAWEFGVGALVALAGARLLALPVGVSRGLTWAGLLGIAVSALAYSESVAYPGWAAVLPVVATAAVLAGGAARVRGSAEVWLGRRPMQVIGRLSYSLYLWHWPVLVLPAAAYGPLGPVPRTGLVALACLLAWATHHLVENPVRRSRRLGLRPSYAMGAVLTASSVAAAMLLTSLPTLATDEHVTPLTSAVAGQGLRPPTVVPANVTPVLSAVLDDLPVVYRNGCHADLPAVDPGQCHFGDPAGEAEVFLIGDSHAAQWFPALEAAARSERWRLTSLTKSGCPAADLPVRSSNLGRDYVECGQWRDSVVQRIRTERPDVVVLSNFASYYDDLAHGDGDFSATWSAALGRLIGRIPEGTRAVVLGDGPAWPESPVQCLSAHLEQPQKCSAPARHLVAGGIQATERATVLRAGPSSATFVSTAEWLCSDVCAGLAGNVVVYRDEHHVTATISRLLVDRMRAAVVGAL